jgi:hypothetical protein
MEGQEGDLGETARPQPPNVVVVEIGGDQGRVRGLGLHREGPGAGIHVPPAGDLSGVAAALPLAALHHVHDGPVAGPLTQTLAERLEQVTCPQAELVPRLPPHPIQEPVQVAGIGG